MKDQDGYELRAVVRAERWADQASLAVSVSAIRRGETSALMPLGVSEAIEKIELRFWRSTYDGHLSCIISADANIEHWAELAKIHKRFAKLSENDPAASEEESARRFLQSIGCVGFAWYSQQAGCYQTADWSYLRSRIARDLPESADAAQSA